MRLPGAVIRGELLALALGIAALPAPAQVAADNSVATQVLRIVRITPAPGDTAAPVGSVIHVLFNAPVPLELISSEAMRLLRGGTPVTGPPAYNGADRRDLVLVVVPQLSEQTTYQLALAPPLAPAETISFTTGRSVPAVSSGSWHTAARMPTRRWGMGAGVIDGKLYVVGGIDASGNILGTLEAYDPATDRWEALPPMPTPRYWLSAGVVNGKLYAIGGTNDQGDLATLEVYDPRTRQWAPRAPGRSRHRFPAAVGIGALLFVDGDGDHNVTEVYDPLMDSWTMRTPPPAADNSDDEILDGVVYDVGAVVQAYDPATDRWSFRTGMNKVRVGQITRAIRGIVYSAGGNDNTKDFFMSGVEAYDPRTDRWTLKASMPTGRAYPAGGVIDGRLYVAGGFDQAGATSVLEVFTP